MRTFSYRGYLRGRGLLGQADGGNNPLAAAWGQFRAWRDDRAWKALTERIRAYAAGRGRRVFLNANGLARYVDLQVLGVWDRWLVKDGQVDLSQSQLPNWRALVVKGQALAGKRVPVVLFHDWGMGDPPFPWLAVSPSQREVWMRIRGAEIYAAGGFFAFPVLGPFGCDAGRDGTLGVIACQTRFYQAHRRLYSEGRFLGSESARTTAPNLSLAEWTTGQPREVALHVINREVRDGRIHSRSNITVELPVARLPESASAVSPDWPGERPVSCALAGGGLKVTLKELEAYAVVRLRYGGSVEVSSLKDPPRVRLEDRWERPSRNVFAVGPDGSVQHGDELNGFLQGRLHVHLRNPPTFLVKATAPGRLLVQVRAVATAGARLEYRIDGQVARAVDIPDRDGKNDSGPAEYDLVLTLPVPSGSHRLTLDNVGPDWLAMTWLEFQGSFGPVAPGGPRGE
jgi:hypothetical protein